MLIDKEQIRKAKEKLGDQNAMIMAKYLGLQNFDERNLKSCCCFHAEDTPSLIYNPKNYTFHCFGCQKTVDLIDVLMQDGLTYIESARKLFELADIPYSFGEVGVRTKREYRYPTPVVEQDKSVVRKYLETRKISNETADYLDIRQDSHSNLVFNFYDTNDVLTMVKYRPSHKIKNGEAKCWCQKDADTTPLLFNMNRINTTMPLLITEGELDCAAAIESGYSNTVSVPLGAGNFHWIEENWDWLEQFDEIIICADNDMPGEKLRKEVIYRLGSWRTKFVDIPCEMTGADGEAHRIKDINEVLFFCGKETALGLILNAKDTPVESVVDFTDIKEVDLSEIDGIYTGIQKFDQELMRLFFGTFNILTGVNGSGKSSFLSQLICQAFEQSHDCWMYSKELPNYMSKNWLNFILAGNRHIESYTTDRGAVYHKVKQSAKIAIDRFYKNRLYIYKDGWPNTLEDIKVSMEDSARKFGCKLFIIDNLTAINLDCGENEKWGKQVDFVNYLIDFAQKYHVVTLLVIHPHKIETMRRLTKFDVAGLGSIVDLAHRLISLYRVTPSDKAGVPKKNGSGWYKEPIKYDVLLDVLKDRMRGRENMTVGLYYDNASRRFFTDPTEYGYQYAWDKTQYSAPLPYPINDETVEVLGEIKHE